MNKLKNSLKYSVLGFTLIEVVITIIILSLIFGIGSKVLQAGFNAYFTNQNITDANTQARLAFERLSRDIHTINSSGSITTASSTQLVFNDINNNSVSYQLTGSQLLRNSQVLADGVSSFTLNYLDKNAAVTSTLTAIRYITATVVFTQGNVSYTLRTTANTMNYQ